MKRIYVVVGELEDSDGIVDTFDSAHLTMEKAEQRCIKLEAKSTNMIWYWREVLLEEEGD